MKGTFILLILIVITLSSQSQNQIKSLTKIENEKIIHYEEYDTNGRIVFIKETPNVSRTEIKSFIYDSIGILRFEIIANTQSGYHIKVPKYDRNDKIHKEYLILNGYYLDFRDVGDEFSFLFSINSFADFVNYPMTKRLLKSTPTRLNRIIDYEDGRKVSEIQYSATGDTSKIATYLHFKNKTVVTYTTNKFKIEQITFKDLNSNIIKKIRIDSNSNYAIIGRDTSEIINFTYDKKNRIIYENIKKLRSPDNWNHVTKKYSYSKSGLVKIKTTTADNTYNRTKKYRYKNNYLVNEIDEINSNYNGYVKHVIHEIEFMYYFYQ